MRENYNVIMVDIKAGCTYYGSRHELRVWYEGMDTNECGCIEYVPLWILKEKGVISKGYSFKKSQDFYNSDEGKLWLGNYIKEKEIEEVKDKLETDIKRMLYNSSIEQLQNIKDYIKAFKS